MRPQGFKLHFADGKKIACALLTLGKTYAFTIVVTLGRTGTLDWVAPNKLADLKLFKLWVEAVEGHVAHVGPRGGVALHQNHTPQVSSWRSGHPLLLLFFLGLQTD